MSGNLRDMQPDHIKTKMDRIHDFYKDTLGYCKGDRDMALVHLCGFLVHARDFMMTKIEMPSDRLEAAVAGHFAREGYEQATRILTEDLKLYRDKVTKHFQAVGQEATINRASLVPLTNHPVEQGVLHDTRSIETNVSGIQSVGESSGESPAEGLGSDPGGPEQRAPETPGL